MHFAVDQDIFHLAEGTGFAGADVTWLLRDRHPAAYARLERLEGLLQGGGCSPLPCLTRPSPASHRHRT